jgi:hypothetical protein
MEELFQFYYYELRSLLTRLDYDMKDFPSLHRFQLEAQRKYFYGELLSWLITTCSSTAVHERLLVPWMPSKEKLPFSSVKQTPFMNVLSKLPQLIHEYSSAVFTSCILIFPVMIAVDKDADFESLQGRDERAMNFKRRVFRNPKYQAVAKKSLLMLDRKGLLDEMWFEIGKEVRE